MCEGQKKTQDEIEQPRKRQSSSLLRRQHSAPDLSNPCPDVLEIVQAVQKIQKEDDDSVYSQIEKYEVPEFKIEIPLTPQNTEKKKLSVPHTTGRVTEKLPKMYEVPAIFDIVVTPTSATGKYKKKLSESEQNRIREILHPPMDDDAISAISMDTRKSRSKKRSSKKKSERSFSLPSLLGDDDEEDEPEFKRSSSDRALCSKTRKDKKKSSRSRSKALQKSKSDPSLSSRRSSRKRSSSKKKRSSSKALKKSNSSPSLSGGSEKKKKKSRKPKKSRSPSSAIEGGKKKKDRSPRSKSTSMLDDDSYYPEAEVIKAQVNAEAAALKAEVDYRLSQVKMQLEQDGATLCSVVTPPQLSTPPITPAQRKSGAHEEERIRVFAESQRRAASLSPNQFKLGNVDGYRMVETNNRRFGKSWNKVQPSPARERKTWSGAKLPSVSVL